MEVAQTYRKAGGDGNLNQTSRPSIGKIRHETKDYRERKERNRKGKTSRYKKKLGEGERSPKNLIPFGH